MQKFQFVLPLLGLILLAPVAFAQTYEIQDTSPQDTSPQDTSPQDTSPPPSQIPHIPNDDDKIGPVGQVDEYTQTYNEFVDWLEGGDVPHQLVNDLPIASVGALSEQFFFVGIDKADAHKKDVVLKTLQKAYPELSIVVDIVGMGSWSVGPAVDVCMSKTDDCNPQLAGMNAFGFDSAKTSAKPFTITMGYKTNDNKLGFIAPKHAFGLGDRGNLVYRDITGVTPVDKHGQVLINTGLNARGNLE